jgi:hypothetical protein
MRGAPILALLAATGVFPALPENPVETPWGAIPRPVVVPRDSTQTGPFGPADSLAPPPPPRPQLPESLPFGPGETLEFSIDYGVVGAGHATMEVAGVRRISGHECLDIRTEAKSNAFSSKFYKVWDRAQTFVDPATVLPWRFEKHQREGGYRKDVVIKFDRDACFARYENGEEVVMHPHAQDELSAFYYLRTLPLETGRDVMIDNHTNRKNFRSRSSCTGARPSRCPPASSTAGWSSPSSAREASSPRRARSRSGSRPTRAGSR